MTTYTDPISYARIEVNITLYSWKGRDSSRKATLARTVAMAIRHGHTLVEVGTRDVPVVKQNRNGLGQFERGWTATIKIVSRGQALGLREEIAVQNPSDFHVFQFGNLWHGDASQT